MELQKFRYYMAVVEHQSFTKAAEQMQISQPMLSRVIRQLEEELGVQLIVRSSRAFSVTDAGMACYKQAYELEQQYKTVFKVIHDVKQAETGEVRISIPGVILDAYFPQLLSAFNRLYPNLIISIVEEGSKLTVQSVLADQVDLGLVMLPIRGSSQLATAKLISNNCQAVVSKRHRLASQTAVAFEDLKKESLITFSDTTTMHDSLIKMCEQAGFTPHIAYKSLMPNFIIDMVRYELGVATLPTPTIQRHMGEDLMYLPLRPDMPWDIAVIHRKNRYQTFASRRLLNFMIEYFGKLNRRNAERARD